MLNVIKASGKLEPLDLNKIRVSLSRAGAAAETSDKILLELKPKLYDKITTKEIYREVFQLFDRYQHGQASRYRLKPALFHLGPSGYPFEKFIGSLFKAMGYQVKIQQIIKGKCVDHEVDLVIEKSGQKFLVECKFHNHAGTKTEIKDALYTQARFEDIGGEYAGIWLVTNTRLTAQAIAYGRCKKMSLLAWRYPQSSGLENLIEKYNLYHLLELGYSKK